MKKFLQINKNDNVAIAVHNVKKGYKEKELCAVDNIPFGHKIALFDMKHGTEIIKYGNVIGHLTADVNKGEYIHSHNLSTNLSGKLDYTFSGNKKYSATKGDKMFLGYKRDNGSVGTRNEIWIIPTVGCVNNTVRILEKECSDFADLKGCDGVFGYTHPFGCSQLGDDQDNTKKILSSLVRHPNAAGALIVSLGCENTNIDSLKQYLNDYDDSRIKFLVTQNYDDEISYGKKLLGEIYQAIQNDKREPLPLSDIKIGLKCGGSDGFSGITANPLCGKVVDKMTSFSASAIMTEVPEMFGAEHILLNRCENRDVFDKAVNMINDFKDYFISHGQQVCENPSPGNKEGGITTLEEKSLGCIQKGGSATVTDVLSYGQRCKKSGLSLFTGPGNDIVATTNLTAAGANIILFTTGRGTPLGAPVPTIKIASNTPISAKKSNWIDFNAGSLTESSDFDGECDKLMQYIIDVASGAKTKNEINGYREISIFKDGVTL